jgi:mannosyl-3-phosphoglycerate phosphatase
MLEYLVFTDLDGTLLNHHDYSFEEANEAIKYLKENSIPLIIVTSKTFSEVRKLQDEIGIKCPFIVENGAGIYIPPDAILTEGVMPHQNRHIQISKAQSYLEIRLFFKVLQKEHNIRGFGDMDKDEVVELTGLDEDSVIHAMRRDFTEPFIAGDDVDIDKIKVSANNAGLDIVSGGRFYHLISNGQDKAKAMKYLTYLYEERLNKNLKMIALGDSANDFTMLEAADVGVLIQLHNGEYADIECTGIECKNIQKSIHPGPKGWNQALLEIFDVI